MTLPSRFELVVTPPSGRAQRIHMTGAVNTAGAIQTLLTQVSAAMDATDAAVSGCTSMAPTDITTWQGLYSGWQTFNQSLSGCLSNVPADQYAPPDVQCISSFGLNWGTAYSQLQSYQQDTVTWQNRVKAACPAFQPAPTPTPSGPTSPTTPGGGGGGAPQQSWLCTSLGLNCQSGDSGGSSVGWPDAIKWGAILGLGLLVVWYVGPLIATVAGVGAGAIRKRASGRDEFEPVAMFKKGYSFGNMDIEAPQLEPLQFGNVPREDVLALIASGQE
jgi:hypothetical protein